MLTIETAIWMNLSIPYLTGSLVLLSQLGYFLGKGTICSMIAVLFVLPGYLYIADRLFIGKKHI